MNVGLMGKLTSVNFTCLQELDQYLICETILLEYFTTELFDHCHFSGSNFSFLFPLGLNYPSQIHEVLKW